MLAVYPLRGSGASRYLISLDNRAVVVLNMKSISTGILNLVLLNSTLFRCIYPDAVELGVSDIILVQC